MFATATKEPIPSSCKAKGLVFDKCRKTILGCQIKGVLVGTTLFLTRREGGARLEVLQMQLQENTCKQLAVSVTCIFFQIGQSLSPCPPPRAVLLGLQVSHSIVGTNADPYLPDANITQQRP